MSSGNSPADVLLAVKKVSDAAADLKRRERKLLEEIAKYEGQRILGDLNKDKNAFMHRPAEGLDFINLVIFEVKAALKEGNTLVLVTGEGKSGGYVVIIGSKNSVDAMSVKVKEAVGGIKGGGGGGKWQGKVAEWKQGDLDALRRLVACEQ
jgi:misacylated tRNA(Ala) deacylase